MSKISPKSVSFSQMLKERLTTMVAQSSPEKLIKPEMPPRIRFKRSLK